MNDEVDVNVDAVYAETLRLSIVSLCLRAFGDVVHVHVVRLRVELAPPPDAEPEFELQLRNEVAGTPTCICRGSWAYCTAWVRKSGGVSPADFPPET